MNTAWFHSPTWLIINALVAYRLTRLWIDDQVPPLPWVREKIQAYADRDFRESTSENSTIEAWSRKVERYGQPPVMFLINCYWCAGFWISIGTVLAASLLPVSVWPFVALPLALSAIVGLLGTRD